MKKGVIREWMEVIVIAGAIAVFFRTFFFQLYHIPTESMVPTLLPGDNIFVSKLVYGPRVPFTHLRLPGLHPPRRGEVVVFIPPYEKNKPFFRRKVYIKRLIGLPGDKVMIKDGSVYINGKIVLDPVIAKNNYFNLGEYGQGEVIVPKDSYFFLGDNSANSMDSRYWGFVKEEDIIGKAIFIWFPFNRIGIIE